MGWLPADPTDVANAFNRVAPGGAASPDDLPEPGLGSRAGTFAKNVGMLGMQGFANTARSVNMLGGAVPALYGDFTGDTGPADDYFKRVVTPLNDAVGFWTPDPKTAGVATNVVGGFLKLGTEAMSGGAASMIGSEQVGTATDLVNEGVDASAANRVGMAVGATNALGLKFDGFGGALWQRVVGNVAGNAALNIATTTTERATLEDAGYADEAKKFNAWDPHARSLDLAAGILQSVFHRGPARVPLGSAAETDAALAAANANRVQTTSAPAAPASAAGENAHVSAFDAAVAAVTRGEKVDVASAINPADFQLDHPNPRAADTVATAQSAAILGNLIGPRATVRDAAVAAGADPQTTLAIARIESGFDVNAKNANSTAAGLGQFLDSTWKSMGGTAANRFDEATQARLLAELTVKNTDALTEALGRAPRPEEVYLAHLLGIGGAKKMLNADPSALVADVAGKRIADQNGMAGMTVAQAVDHWKQKLAIEGSEPAPAQEKAASTSDTTTGAATSATSTTSLPARDDGRVTESMPQDSTPAAADVNAAPPAGISADYRTARETAAANPDLVITDDSGQPMRAGDAVAATDAQLAADDHFSKLYDIVTNCALRGGH